jgi:hypothetical protein
MFIGYVVLDETLHAVVLIRDAARTPVNLDAAPRVRVYGPDGLVAAATGVGSFLDTAAVTDASNTTPIVVTSPAHGLTTGTYVTVSGVLGNAAANGSFTVTRLTASTFELDGSVGGGAYTSGGVWNVAGLYTYSVAAEAARGFEAGLCYAALIQGAVAGVPTAETQTFIVT